MHYGKHNSITEHRIYIYWLEQYDIHNYNNAPCIEQGFTVLRAAPGRRRRPSERRGAAGRWSSAARQTRRGEERCSGAAWSGDEWWSGAAWLGDDRRHVVSWGHSGSGTVRRRDDRRHDTAWGGAARRHARSTPGSNRGVGKMPKWRRVAWGRMTEQRRVAWGRPTAAAAWMCPTPELGTGLHLQVVNILVDK
jgi:hypothetical protein